VDLNDEMVRMLIVQRAYAANAQVIQAADQLMSISNNLRRS
jgi:flagellar basal-body rod protein FlgG